MLYRTDEDDETSTVQFSWSTKLRRRSPKLRRSDRRTSSMIQFRCQSSVEPASTDEMITATRLLFFCRTWLQRSVMFIDVDV
ncbi:hypothetical protein FOZ60_016741 [Perkinsus olseni]|uniref:Uncharacterized protein n=1 Tax=Perkinsus olseni TaxID=32597 RepID=A0A7J6P566_PEROL|nr:hypothetical protein FOZ60_016741 [Perkinsus olseni]